MSLTQPFAGLAKDETLDEIKVTLGTPMQERATMPVSGPLTDAQLRAAPLALPSGASTLAGQDAIVAAIGAASSATQPVSGTVTVGNSSIPVTGTFFQATQPVSGTVGISGPVAVTGTFFQATQPVSIAAPLAILAQRRDSDTSDVADNADSRLHTDEEGRLKVSSKPASFSDVTGNITTIQPTIGTPVVGATVIGDVSRASNVVMFCTGTYAGIACSFEGSLEATGENWFSIQAVRTNANTVETITGTLSATPLYAWELSVNALARVRVRATARTSGTQSWRFKLGTYATEPIPASQVSATQPISGSVTATTTPATPTASIINSAASTNGTVVKASAGTLYGLTVSNTNAAARFLKLHNSATVTPGSTAVALTIPIPAGAAISLNFGEMGMRFGTGICLSITGLAGDSDTTAIGLGEVKALVSFI